jgi:hypothetical protein
MLDVIRILDIVVPSILTLTALVLMVALLYQSCKLGRIGQYLPYCGVLVLILVTWPYWIVFGIRENNSSILGYAAGYYFRVDPMITFLFAISYNYTVSSVKEFQKFKV